MNHTVDTRNYLLKSKYLFFENDGVLHDALLTGVVRDSVEMDPMLHIIVIRILNSDDKVLVYNHISYHSIFTLPVVYYLANRNISILKVYKDQVPCLSLLDSSLYDDNNRYLCFNNEQKQCADIVYRIAKTCDFSTRSEIQATYHRVFDLAYILGLKTDIDHMSKLVELAFYEEYSLFLREIIDLGDINEKLSSIAKPERRIGVLNGCIFVVGGDNLKLFIDAIRNKGFNINTNVRKHRGSVNSMNNFLNLLDQDFRNSLYLHNQYHVDHGFLPQKYGLIKKAFSFKNIHMNIGNVR